MADAVTVTVPCQCGQVARKRLSLEEAEQYVSTLQAAIAGIPPAPVVLYVPKENR